MRRSVRFIASSPSRRRCCLSIPTITWCIISGNRREVWPTTPNGTLGGDYEFVISDATAERIELKGKKYGNRIVMKALTEDQTWKQYLTRIKKVEDDAFFL